MAQSTFIVKKNFTTFGDRQIADVVAASYVGAVTTSLKIAEVFEKEHEHVLCDIRNIIAKLEKFYDPDSKPINALRSELCTNFTKNNFIKSYYIDDNGEHCTMYNLTVDAFMFTVGEYTGISVMEYKIAYIRAFNSMRDLLLKQHVLLLPAISYTGKSEIDYYPSIMCKRTCHEQQRNIAALYDELDTIKAEAAYYRDEMLKARAARNELQKCLAEKHI